MLLHRGCQKLAWILFDSRRIVNGTIQEASEEPAGDDNIPDYDNLGDEDSDDEEIQYSDHLRMYQYTSLAMFSLNY